MFKNVLRSPIRSPIRSVVPISATQELIQLLFGNNAQGVFYVPQPKVDGQQVLYRDAAGTIPVTADGDPVGLMLDLSKGLVKGPELVTNGTFDTDLSGWTFAAPWQWSNGRAYSPYITSYRELRQLVGGRDYYQEFKLDYEIITGEMNIIVSDSTGVNSVRVSVVGVGVSSYSSVIPPGYDTITFARKGELEGYLDNISVRELPGNHATQSVAASRPIYRTDGTLHWLEFDGVDDYLETGIWTLDEFWFVSYAISQAAYAAYHGPWRFLIEGGSPTSRSTNRLEDYTRNNHDRVIYSRVETVGAFSDRGFALPAAGTRYVGWAGYNPAASHNVGEQWNGNEQQVSVSNLVRSPGTGSLSLSRGYSGDFMPGNYYGMVFTTGTPVGDSDREFVNAYMRSRGGITL